MIVLSLKFSYLATLLVASDAFSPLVGTVPRTVQPSLAFMSTSTVSLQQRTVKMTTLYSSSPEEGKEKEQEEVEEDKTPTPITDGLQRQSESFTTEPQPQQRLDPLVASLTRMDEEMMNTPTTKVPLLGEIPLDGSIVVLLPVALIAVVGFVMSINIAFNSKDAIVEKMDEINNVLSAPPVKKAPETEGCRGLCSDQEEQLDSMRNFMNSLAPKKAQEAAIEVVPDIQEIKEEVTPLEIKEVKEVVKEEVLSTPVATSEEVKTSEDESQVAAIPPE
mmetsp:Transcript_9143/g.11437  ORF Transcript_9143/g.11437 Transcript_9143/m.11437 type:complete len:276 (+) Transcript_9143:75-902(+)